MSDVTAVPAITAAATGQAAPVPAPTPVALPAAAAADPLSRKAGPDVSIGLTNQYAVFNVDPQTRAVKITVLDESGRVLRMIPPDSVLEMNRVLAAYPRR